MHNNAPDTLLNDAWEDGERRRQTSISIGEDINVRTIGPGLVEGSVDGLLHILAIEIDWGLSGPAGIKKYRWSDARKEYQNISRKP